MTYWNQVIYVENPRYRVHKETALMMWTPVQQGVYQKLWQDRLFWSDHRFWLYNAVKVIRRDII